MSAEQVLRTAIIKQQMCRSQWVYNRLRRFRAGVESIISWIKRSLGFDRCTWKGQRSFESYVWLSAVKANLITLARAKAVWSASEEKAFYFQEESLISI